jgi:hypothetical protein
MPHIKVFFFLFLLISPGLQRLNAQTTPVDTLKKVSADTIVQQEESSALDEKITYSAEDSVVALVQAGKVILYGNAKVIYGSMNMDAEFLEIDYKSNIIKAYGAIDSLGKRVGTPTFKDGDQTMEADTVKYNLRSKKGKIYNALTEQGELLVIGSEIKKDSNDVIYFKNMLCLPCKEADARTGFRATKAKVIPNDKIVTGPMFLEVGGVPTPLGLPFGYFPNTKKQHNGIILPAFGNSPSFGFNLQKGGFYWGINDKTDLFIRSDIYANGSWLLGATNNYNVLYKARGTAGVSYSEFNIGDRDIPSEFTKQKSYAIDWVHTQDNRSNPSVRFSANVNFRNNQKFNRLNAINTGQFLQNTFQSNINHTKTFKFGSLSLNALHTQNSLSNRMDIVFPSLTFNLNRFYPFKRERAVRQNVFDKIQMVYLMEARNTLSGDESRIFKGSIIDSLRNGVRHSLPISTNFNILKYITATPAVNLTGFMYGQTIRRDFISDDVRDTVIMRTRKDGAFAWEGSFNTNFSTQVYFDYLFLSGKLKQVRHLLIPSVQYNYRPDFGEERFGNYKQVQLDSIGNVMRYSIYERAIFDGPSVGKINGISINLNNNLEAKLKQNSDTGVSYKKIKILQNLSMSGAYNFAADSFKMSAVSINGRTILFKYFDINATANVDPYRYDPLKGDKVNQFQFSHDGRAGRLTYVKTSVLTSIGSNMLAALKKTRQAEDLTNAVERGSGDERDNIAPLEWNLSLNYNLILNNGNDGRMQPSHQLSATGDINPTKYWRIGVTTGFDFNTQDLSYTTLNIYRDLKCWEARIDWVPFGVRKSYSLTVNLKTAMLSEFKIPRQRQWYDNFQ